MYEVNVAELKARLSAYLKRVRQGSELTVMHRDTPIARVVPYEASAILRVREPSGGPRALSRVPLPPPLALDVDIVELLAEERQLER